MAAIIFLADCMLGRLAKWLRILGYDTAYYSDINDEELVYRALQEGRVILTRDTHLIKRKLARRCLLIESDQVLEQLKQVIDEFKLKPPSRRILRRCLLCNTPLKTLSKGKVKGRVPPYVYKTQRSFAYCTRCDRIYWRGTHISRVFDRLSKLGSTTSTPLP
ncbi:hypothetical protein CEE39_02825 [bacterium (candidate division B38) B3_B38]|nr:MAG: hypothetical protein CEE39_02825 [bacterium (candidate division B38) B3_B38]